MKPTIKYLLNGEYHYATVKDIGDIEKLKTEVKTDLVGAINSLLGHTETIPENLQERLIQFETDIDELMTSGFNEQELVELQTKITATQEEITAEVEARIAALERTYDERLDTVTSEYDKKVEEINTDLGNVKTNLETAENSLEETGKKLSSVDLNITEMSKTVDFVKGELESKIDSTDFNLLEATVEENSTSINQNKKDIELKASQKDLNLATGRIADAEADIKLNAEGITSAVKRDELRKELDNVNIYGSNLLRNTRDWESWEANVPARAYIISDTYNHLHIQEQTGSGNYLESNLAELEVGKTYVASIYAKSSSNNAKAMLKVDSTEYEMKNHNGDTFLSTSWQRVSVSFVASASDTDLEIAFTTSNVDNSATTHFAGAKIEDGATHTGWQANEADTYERLISTESTVKQHADQITSVVDKQEKIGEDITSQTTQINQMSDEIGLHAEKLEEIDGEVSRQKASIELNSDSIKSKVEQEDIDKSIEGISLDNRNLVLNSDFILGMDSWSNVNENFSLENIDGKNHLTISRSGLSNNIVASASSNMFAVKAGDKLSIGLDVTVANLAQFDVKTVAVLDLFDINDNRVYLEELSLDKLEGELEDGKTGRLTTRYNIDRDDVVKARLRLTLYRNGSVSFTNITIEKGDIKSVGWAPAPEDSQLVQANMKTLIDQNAKDITLKAESDTVDKLTEDLESNSAELKVASDKIEANINSLTRVDETLEEHSAKITATAEELSSKMTSTQVDELLEGKKYATQSELNQTSDIITASVSTLDERVSGIQKNYIWLMYADSETGEGISSDPTGKQYVGIATNKPTDKESLNPQDYKWTRIKGDTGQGAISAYLTNDFHSVSTASDGSGGDYGSSITQMVVMDGSNDVTEDWQISVDEPYGVVGELEGNTYKVNELYVDSVEIKLIATKGEGKIEKYFTIAKVKQGLSGEASTVYKLNKSSLVIVKTKEGDFSPNNITLSSASMTGNGDYEPFKAYFVIYERSEKAMTIDEYILLHKEGVLLPDKEYIISDKEHPYVMRYASSTPESEKQYAPSSNIISLYIEIYKDENRTKLLDSESIMVLTDGTDGEDSYRVDVLSSQGNIFKNGQIETTLYAKVYRGSEDVTEQINASRFRWRRASSDVEGDNLWNTRNAGGVKEITITHEDVQVRASFSCEIRK